MKVPDSVLLTANIESSMSIRNSDLVLSKDKVPLGLIFSKFFNVENLSEEQLNEFNVKPIYFVLSAFSGRIAVSVDQFAISLAEYAQVTFKDTTKIEDAIKNFVA